MLSICIPVFNFDIRNLVKALHQQGQKLDLPFEICCLDDGSNEAFREINREIKGMDGVIYEELPQNVGRSKIRNLLADQARYNFLVFMDCDSALVGDQFLENYLQHLDSHKLLYGGRVYEDTKPKMGSLYLHWLFGKNREEIPAEIRAQNPYHSFMTNNFVIPKAIFQDIRFDEQLTQYGHEDTLFGLELKAMGVLIVHMNNPLEHIGLETNQAFLSKTEKAIENLNFLIQAEKPISTKLLRFQQKLKALFLDGIFGKVFSVFQGLITRKLLSKKPTLFWLDVYKLGYFIQLQRKNQNKRAGL